ncbi:VOC family protein [Streptomyces sp. NPDC003042]
MARDLRAAQEFYGAVLGWDFPAARLHEDTFAVGFSDGVPVAGIGALTQTFPVPVAWLPYFAVDDADLTAARILERSGTVAVGPLSYGTGRAALAADRDGAAFGIWQGDAIPDWGLDGAAAPAWLELRTRDAFDASIFYGEVLQWACDDPGCCEVSFHAESEHILLRHGRHTVARLRGGALAGAPDPHIRPRWRVHFRVPDVEAAVKAATEFGGHVIAAGDPAVEGTTLRDPEGALFGVAAPAGPGDGAGPA